MPGLLQSGAVLAVAAYARVNIDGTSPDMNSGVTTSRSATGTYLIDLPAGLAQPIGRDLVVLTVRRDNGSSPNNAVALNYIWNSTSEIEVGAWLANGEINTRINTPFDFVLLRSTISPPAGSTA